MEQKTGNQSRASNDDQAEPHRVAFNFDVWARLARENPDEFERRRELLIRENVFCLDAEDRRIQAAWIRQ